MDHSDHLHAIIGRLIAIDHPVRRDDQFANLGVAVLWHNAAELGKLRQALNVSPKPAHHCSGGGGRIQSDVSLNLPRLLLSGSRPGYSSHCSLSSTNSSCEISSLASAAAMPISIWRRTYKV